MKKIVLSLLLLPLCLGAVAQNMFDYSDIRAGRFAEKGVPAMRSVGDGEHYTALYDGSIVKYSYKTGEQVSVVVEAVKAAEKIGAKITDYALSPDESRALLTTLPRQIYRHSYSADHWIYNLRSEAFVRLSAEGGERVPQFSPDGINVAYVKDNDLWYVDTNAGQTVRVTDDGRVNHVINGHADWVYEEEFVFTRAFAFSPDGSQIAYLRFDESEVKEYSIQRFGGELYPGDYTYKYPKAGEANARVELWVWSVAEGSKTKIDIGPDADQYIPHMGWTPAGKLYFYRLDRRHKHFEVLLADRSGHTRVVYEERDNRFVERPTAQTVTFLPKGDRFVVMNETRGYRHLYTYHIDGGPLDTLTVGNWDVTRVLGVTGDRVYYMSNEGSPLRNNLWSVRLNGKGKTRLTKEEGTYRISPSEGFKYFVSHFSNASTPSLARLHDASGKVVRTLEDNAALHKTLGERRVPQKEFIQVNNDRGTLLNGYVIKPWDFDQSKRYPVLMTQYGGPDSQQALDRWSMDWTDVLVQEGYIVVCVDGRGTGGRGAPMRKGIYGNLGGQETEDQIAVARYMGTLPYVDAKRIGIYGWSFGGFIALNSILRGDGLFRMAIAVAPVTSWRFYDTIYTEMFNGLPSENPAGYDDNSPINFAAGLKGKLLLIHGTGDDNVHVQNTYRMAEALTRAGKQFDMMIYPDDNHSMHPSGGGHVMETMIRYTVDNL